MVFGGREWSRMFFKERCVAIKEKKCCGRWSSVKELCESSNEAIDCAWQPSMAAKVSRMRW